MIYFGHSVSLSRCWAKIEAPLGRASLCRNSKFCGPKEAFRRQQLGEWAGVFTQESPRETRRAIRDLRIRVETTIQKLESYPPQNRHLGFAMWRARYERMLEDYKHLAPEQQKQVQPVMDVMKYFAAPSN